MGRVQPAFHPAPGVGEEGRKRVREKVRGEGERGGREKVRGERRR